MSNRRRPIVLVDPQDQDVLFWWPAIVLLAQDMIKFYEYTNGDYVEPEEGEMTVCYLEDGSFSNVVEKETIPFDLNGKPFSDYLQFKELQDEKGLQMAVKYMNTGVLPGSLKWLESNHDRKDKKEKIKVRKVLDPISKKRLAAEMHQLKNI
jgi:hypothetical protein